MQQKTVKWYQGLRDASLSEDDHHETGGEEESTLQHYSVSSQHDQIYSYFIFVCHQLSLRLVLSLLCNVYDSFHLISLLMIITMIGRDYHKVSLLYRAFLLYKNQLYQHIQ